MITKNELDKLVEKYETTDFIKDDPIQFPHRFKNKEDIELAGFIASLFAYGNRKMFIAKLNDLFNRADNDIANYVKNGEFKNLKGLEYRFSKDYDIIPIFEILHNLYKESRGLEELFEYGWNTIVSNQISPHPSPAWLSTLNESADSARQNSSTLCRQSAPPRRGNDQVCSRKYNDYLKFFQTVVDYFYSRAPKTVGQGFYHMLPNPANGGAMKRINMFLRWMIRKSPVDLGIWDFMQPKDLLIPLDVHVARISRNMGLLNRKSNDFKAVIELTSKLKEFSPNDPTKYDFAMFAFGVELNSTKLGA